VGVSVCLSVCVSVCVSYNDLEMEDNVVSVNINPSAFVTVDDGRLSKVGFPMQVITLDL